jgi:hypothetical protein
LLRTLPLLPDGSTRFEFRFCPWIYFTSLHDSSFFVSVVHGRWRHPPIAKLKPRKADARDAAPHRRSTRARLS